MEIMYSFITKLYQFILTFHHYSLLLLSSTLINLPFRHSRSTPLWFILWSKTYIARGINVYLFLHQTQNSHVPTFLESFIIMLLAYIILNILRTLWRFNWTAVWIQWWSLWLFWWKLDLILHHMLQCNVTNMMLSLSLPVNLSYVNSSPAVTFWCSLK